MSNDIYEFIDKIKEDYFTWLYDISPETFPRVCDLSSDVLASYLTKKYPEENIKFIRGRFDIWSHFWIEVNGRILDFTIIQFMGNYEYLLKFDKSNIEYYQEYFSKYLDSPFIPGRFYNRYKVYEEIEPSYINCKYIGNFNKYLKWVENELNDELNFIKENVNK